MTALVDSSHGISLARELQPLRAGGRKIQPRRVQSDQGLMGSGERDVRAPAANGVRSSFVFLPLHEGAWSIYSRHGGGGLLFRRRR
jgi:hypothetical protein